VLVEDITTTVYHFIPLRPVLGFGNIQLELYTRFILEQGGGKWKECHVKTARSIRRRGVSRNFYGGI
jgi:hypothetical protein